MFGNQKVDLTHSEKRINRKMAQAVLNYFALAIACGAATSITEYYAFEAVNKSHLFKHLVHKAQDNQNLKFALGAIFAVCTLINNTVLGKGGITDFKKALPQNLNWKAIGLFCLKMLLGASANAPTAYLTYHTLKKLEGIPMLYREPMAITASLLNEVFFMMLNTTGLSLENTRSFYREESVNKWVKMPLLGWIGVAGLITAAPSAINGERFIRSMIIDDEIVSNIFAITALMINTAFLVNANLPVYTALARGIGKRIHSATDNSSNSSVENSRWTNRAFLALNLLGVYCFSLLASSFVPAIFRETLKGDAKDSFLDIGEAISLVVISMQAYYYLGRIFFSQEQRACFQSLRIEEIDEERQPILESGQTHYCADQNDQTEINPVVSSSPWRNAVSRDNIISPENES